MPTIDPPEGDDDLLAWLKRHAQGCTYLLAHAEDGVIWGRFDAQGELTISHDAFPEQCQTTLELATLWQCRMFSPEREVLLWRDDSGWHARTLTDPDVPTGEYIDEAQMLWGDHAEARAEGFTLLADGREGLRHAVPLDIEDKCFVDPERPDSAKRPLRLVVRHYVSFDTDGNARIGLSRLKCLGVTTK